MKRIIQKEREKTTVIEKTSQRDRANAREIRDNGGG